MFYIHLLMLKSNYFKIRNAPTHLISEEYYICPTKAGGRLKELITEGYQVNIDYTTTCVKELLQV